MFLTIYFPVINYVKLLKHYIPTKLGIPHLILWNISQCSIMDFDVQKSISIPGRVTEYCLGFLSPYVLLWFVLYSVSYCHISTYRLSSKMLVIGILVINKLSSFLLSSYCAPGTIQALELQMVCQVPWILIQKIT